MHGSSWPPQGWTGISSWGPGQSDFILVNYNVLSGTPYDFGVLNYSATYGFTAEVASSNSTRK